MKRTWPPLERANDPFPRYFRTSGRLWLGVWGKSLNCGFRIAEVGSGKFSAAKDKPVLFSAYATADILIVLDRADFAGVIADGFYGLKVMLPGSFLRFARSSGKLI